MQKLLRKKLGKKKAFTLVEILIVVAVIGILFVALVPRIDFAGDKARETGIKTDFRSFELAAEQILRENAGVSRFETVTELCDEGGINLYLDKAVQFDKSTGNCAKKDQWNQPYSIQLIKPDSAYEDNRNNGAIVFVSNGQDSSKEDTDDNYVLVVTFVDGQIETSTSGFSSNILSDNIAIDVDSTAAMEIDASGFATVKYAK